MASFVGDIRHASRLVEELIHVCLPVVDAKTYGCLRLMVTFLVGSLVERFCQLGNPRPQRLLLGSEELDVSVAGVHVILEAPRNVEGFGMTFSIILQVFNCLLSRHDVFNHICLFYIPSYLILFKL